MSETRCVCGKKRKMTQRKILGKTCGSHSCAGKNSKKHMQEVRKCHAGDPIAPRQYTPYHDH